MRKEFQQLLPAPHLTAELPWYTDFRGVVLATGAVIYSFEGQALVSGSHTALF